MHAIDTGIAMNKVWLNPFHYIYSPVRTTLIGVPHNKESESCTGKSF
ncbi:MULTISPECIES: hypothetical protein [Aeromonas]|nr:hypothetical protein [Aeromonas dhakensis]HDZ8895586.1 hypothetical protein [Aeromonas dhakensis]